MKLSHFFFLGVLKLLVIFLGLKSTVVSIIGSGVLKSPILTVLVSISAFSLVLYLLYMLECLMLGAYLFIIVISSLWIDPFIIIYNILLCVLWWFGLKFILSKYIHSCFLLVAICIEHLYSSVIFSLCILKSKVSLL